MKYYNIKIIMKVIIIIFKFLIYETIHNEQKKNRRNKNINDVFN